MLLFTGKSLEAQIQVYVFIMPDCPVCKYYLPKLHQLALSYKDASCRFYYVVPSKYLSEKEKKKFNRELRTIVSAPNEQIYPQPTDSICSRLNAKITPEIFVLDSNNNIVYSGAIDDKYSDVLTYQQETTQFYLQQAIDHALNNQIQPITRVEPVGCIISR